MTSDRETCRLCAGAVTPRFRAVLLDKYDIAYAQCGDCGSLQTESPFWLDEAYALNLGDMDCGAAQRNLSNTAACLIVSRLWGVRDAVDHGGGDGLLTRLLRDHGINCFVEDKYAAPTYAQAFTTPDFATPDAIFAFEVFEHFVTPAAEIDALFARKPAILFGSTELYAGQGADWWYLSRHSGHHVFFYGDRALGWIGRRHGYRAIRSGGYFLFVRNDLASAFKLALVRLLLRGPMLRLMRALAVIVPTRGPGHDIALIRKRNAAR
jgi:hypothetical protein